MSGRLHIMRPKLFIAAAGLSVILAIPVSVALNSRDKEIKSQERVNHSLQLKIDKLKQTRAKKLNDIKLAAAIQKTTPAPVATVTPPTTTPPAAQPVAPPSCDTHECWMSQAGIAQSDFAAVDFIVSHESGWNPNATEPNSGAHGLPQALPYSKTGCGWVDAVCQLRWANGYAVTRYGGWWAAQAYWALHRNW